MNFSYHTVTTLTKGYLTYPKKNSEMQNSWQQVRQRHKDKSEEEKFPKYDLNKHHPLKGTHL